MPSFVSHIHLTDIVDAYVDEAEPLFPVESDRLLLGGPTGAKKRIWYGFPFGTNFSFPPDAHIFKATFHARVDVPAHLHHGLNPPFVFIKRVTGSYSESTLTQNVLEATEALTGNWPLENIDQFQWPTSIHPSTPNTHVEESAQIDVTEWWRLVASGVIGSPHLGFILEADTLPLDHLGQHQVFRFHDRSDPDVISNYDKAPLFTIEYGLNVHEVRALEVTAYGAHIVWDPADGADYYVLEFSRDNGATWTALPAVVDPEFDLALAPAQTYAVRVSSGYEDRGLTTPSAPIAFTTASFSNPGLQLTAPGNPSLTMDATRHHVILGFPTGELTESPSVDQWQVARLRGNLVSQVGGPSEADIVATIPLVALWTDRFPTRTLATYYIRGRVDAENNLYTPWSSGIDNDFTANAALIWRSALESPNSVLELLPTSIGGGISPTYMPSAVETAKSWRYSVNGGDIVRLDFIFRAYYQFNTSPASAFYYGIRWYDRDGNWISDTVQGDPMSLVNSIPQTRTVSLEATAPPAAGSCAVLFYLDWTGNMAVAHKVRVEHVAVYRRIPSLDTGWVYQQMPDSAGFTPDFRTPTVDQNAFQYDGVGWGPLSSPPSGAFSSSPFKETITPDDEAVFVNVGQWVDILLYGSPTPTIIEVSRQIDQAVNLSANPSSLSWLPLVDDAIGTVVTTGAELVINPGAEVDLTGWQNSAHTDLNYASGGTLSRITAGVISGAGSFQSAATTLGHGAIYTGLLGQAFLAGNCYRFRFKVQRVSGATTGFWSCLIGFSEVSYPSAVWVQEVEEKDFTVDDSLKTITVYWTPRYDSDKLFIGLRMVGGSAQTIKWDDVSVQKVLGYQLPTSSDFALAELKIPPVFNTFFPTPLKLKLVSGVMRPVGLRRDYLNTIEMTSDFATTLRALGDLRNATSGELEFRSDLDPPTVFHHARRGKDHSQVPGGIDLRPEKNITLARHISDPSQIVNRLIVLGYGEDRHQIVVEVRSQKDRSGRLPSDVYYRHDKFGRSPHDPEWDVVSGGTSEEIYGVRYGKVVDTNIVTYHRAREVGGQVVEQSAWPSVTYDVEAVDLSDVQVDIEVGDLVPFRYRGEDHVARIIEYSYDISQPRRLKLTLGDDPRKPASLLDKVTKDLETNLSALNSATGAAD